MTVGSSAEDVAKKSELLYGGGGHWQLIQQITAAAKPIQTVGILFAAGSPELLARQILIMLINSSLLFSITLLSLTVRSKRNASNHESSSMEF